MSQAAIIPATGGRGVSPWTVIILTVLVACVVLLGLMGASGLLVLAAVGAFVVAVVWRHPVVGILIYIVTFLFTYPSAFRGVGNFTINNVLGLLFVPLMLVTMLREGSVRLFKLKPLVMIGIAVLTVILSAAYYHPTEDPLAQRIQEKIAKSKRAQGPALIQTRGAQQKATTRFVFLCFFVFFIRTPRDLKLAAATVVACLLASYTTASSGVGPAGWGTGRLRLLGEAGTGVYAARNPNKLAFFMLFALTILWYWRRAIRSVVVYPLWFAATVMTFVMIPLTGSRSGVLNLLLFIGIVLLEGRFSLTCPLGLPVSMCEPRHSRKE